MKNQKEQYIVLGKAIERIQNEPGFVSEQSIRAAIRRGEIPHIRSCSLPKARIMIRVSDLKDYLQKLKHTS